jgi:hypothetical protein
VSQPKQINIDDASKEQLIQFAQENLGMDFHPNTGAQKVLAGIRAAWRPNVIYLFGEEDPGQSVEIEEGSTRERISAHTRSLEGGSSKTDPKVRMVINEAEGPGGTRPIFVSVNNVPMLLPRGEEIAVPYRYYLALKAAVMTIHEQDENTYEVTSRDVPSYPFQIISLPTAEEMHGWNKQEHESQYPLGEAPPMEATAA